MRRSTGDCLTSKVNNYSVFFYMSSFTGFQDEFLCIDQFILNCHPVIPTLRTYEVTEDLFYRVKKSNGSNRLLHILLIINQ